MAIGIILGVILAIFAIGGYILMGVSYENDHPVGGTAALCIAILLTLSLFIVPFSFHTVQTGEIAVVKTLGEITDVRTAGTHFDFWMTKQYTKYDTKVRNVDIVSAAYSSDAQTMDIQMTIQYQIMADKVVDIATHYGSLDTLQSRIESIAIEKTKSVLSSYKAMDIIANRAAISPAVETAIKDAIGEEYYVNVVAVVLTNIDFSDAFEQAVEDKMIAEQTKLKAQYDNETKIAQAEAEAAAKLKAAEAEIEIAKAKAEALKIEAQAQAEANDIIANSITKEILEKMYYDVWDGKLPIVVGDGEYILPSDILQ
jgi:regulator of protease activity HflC (stomatin/prohibitin superfamily)